jgi:DNA-binding NtrC family response regulator
MQDGATTRQAQLHVIVCETDDLLRTVLLDAFTEEGMDVTLCSSGEELEHTLKRKPQSVVVTELWTDSPIKVPASDRERLRRLATKTRVVVTTAKHLREELTELRLGDAIMLINKPYDLEQLLEAVRRAARASQ